MIFLKNKSQKCSDFEFLEILKAGEKDTAIEFLTHEFLQGSRISHIVDYPIQKALQFLGDSDAHQPGSIYEEHRATQICIAAINQIQSYLTSSQRFNALTCCLANDPYFIPPLSIAAVIKECGGQCTNIGPNTPIETLLNLDASNLRNLDIITVSISQIECASKTKKDLIQLSDCLNQYNIELILGGRLASKLSIKSTKITQLPTLNALDLYLKDYKKNAIS